MLQSFPFSTLRCPIVPDIDIDRQMQGRGKNNRQTFPGFIFLLENILQDLSFFLESLGRAEGADLPKRALIILSPHTYLPTTSPMYHNL